MGRRAAQRQVMELQKSFRAAVSDGRLSPNAILPPVRELGLQYDLSPRAVVNALQVLVEEGILRSVPRVGFFVGASVKREAGLYLMLLSRMRDLEHVVYIHMQMGFEERISKLGGSSLVIDVERMQTLRQRGELPALAGIFNLTTINSRTPENLESTLQTDDVPNVWVRSQMPAHFTHDTVSFDDMTGGSQATRHLLGLGHRRIAFLGLHTPEDERTNLRDQENDGLMWSLERYRGWTKAMREAGIEDDDLYFHPRHTAYPFDSELQKAASIKAARDLAAAMRSREITAVVAVNGSACRGLLETFQELQVAESDYPSLVAFDDVSDPRGQIITTMRLPWQRLGQNAADVLWERHHGELHGAPIHRAVPMRLIPRLSCRTDWSALALAS